MYRYIVILDIRVLLIRLELDGREKNRDINLQIGDITCLIVMDLVWVAK